MCVSINKKNENIIEKYKNSNLIRGKVLSKLFIDGE